MKNFRKTIIALATVAAMLVPSVAMAATITAEVENAAVEGNVYAGFYKGDVLVKAELGGTTKVETTTTGGDSSTEEAADGATASAKIVTVDDANDIKKITFTVTPDEKLTTTPALQLLFSFDNSVVELVSEKGAAVTIAGDGSEEPTPVAFYDGSDYDGGALGNTVAKWYTKDSTTYGWLVDGSGNAVTVPAYGMDIFGVYFKVKDGQTLTADTFSIVTEEVTDPFITSAAEYTTAGIFVGSADNYVTYGAWDGREDTLAWNGVEIVEDVEPDGKPVVTVTNELANPITGVYKLVFAVKAPAGTAVMDAKFDLSVDTNDVSFWHVANGENITSLKKAAIKNASVFPKVETCSECGYEESWYYATGSAISVADSGVATMNVALSNVGCDDCAMEFATPFAIDNKVMIMEFYYTVNEGATVDENTFSFSNATFDETAADFAGFPWKAAETTTTTKTVITVNDVVAPADYDSIKVFVWDDKQIAQCDPVAGTLN